MKQIIPIAIIALFGLSFQSFDRPFQLKPKVGIDELRFGIATVKDVKRSYSRHAQEVDARMAEEESRFHGVKVGVLPLPHTPFLCNSFSGRPII